MNEIWKDIIGYEGLYQVSNLGRVKSLPKLRGAGSKYISKEKVMKHHNDRYSHIGLMGKGKWVHRLVAEAFIPNPENKSEVNHIDGNRFNNHIENLEWVTRIENEAHSLKIGLRGYGENNKISKKINQYDRSGLLLKTWTGIREIERKTNISHTAIGNCLKGRSKTSGKYVWKYA